MYNKTDSERKLVLGIFGTVTLILVAIIPTIYFLRVLKSLFYDELYLPWKYKRDVLNKVRWIVVEGDLWNCIFYVLKEKYLNCKIENKYFGLNDIEEDFVEEILEEYKNYMMKLFFYGKLAYTEKMYYQLFEREYYFFYLWVFLDVNFRDYERQRKLKEKVYDKGNGTHKLTDYSNAYLKLWLIVSLFCENNEKIANKMVYKTDMSDILKGYLKEQEINN